MPSNYLSTDQAGAQFGLSPRTLRRWVKSGRLQIVETGPGGVQWTTAALVREALGDGPQLTPQQKAANAVGNELIVGLGWWLCRQCGQLLSATELEYSDGDCPDCETDEFLEPTRDPRRMVRDA